jgi:hypothetical protein
MAYDAQVIKVMISSPSDVAEERRVAIEIIHEWNTVHSLDRRMVLLPVAWETHSAPSMGATAQEVINRQVLADADVLVAMFWTRLGTPTEVAESGTVEEIRRHSAANRPVMLYFSNAPVRPDSVEDLQYAKLRDFKSWCRDRSLFQEYDSTAEFKEKFRRQLTQTIIRDFPMPVKASNLENRARIQSPIHSLSEDAAQLLKSACEDPNGVILATLTMDGFSVQGGNAVFVYHGTSREMARWKAVLAELQVSGLIEQRDAKGEVFSVTDAGYTLGDKLKSSLSN